MVHQQYEKLLNIRGGVAIALEHPDHTFSLVRQYRYAQQKELLEFPAGKKEKGEDPLHTAMREVAEETGYTGKEFTFLTEIVPTGAYDSEVISLYYAKADQWVGQHFDQDERLHVCRYTLEQISAMILNQEITDAKTIAIAYFLERRKAYEKY